MKYPPIISSGNSGPHPPSLLNISPATILKLLSGFILLLFTFSSILAFFKYYLHKSTNLVHILLNFFYLDNENNIPTYFSSVFLLTAALLLIYISLHKLKADNQFKYYWLLLGFVFLMLSMDEFMSVHELMIEPIQELLKPSGILHFAWVIPGMLFVGALGLLFIRFLVSLRGRFRNKFLSSALLYLGGALGIEMIGGYIGYSSGTENFLYAMVANLEELLEMLGIAYFIYSLLLYTREELALNLMVNIRETSRQVSVIGIKKADIARKDRPQSAIISRKIALQEKGQSSK